MKDFLEWAKPGSREAELANGLDAGRLPRHVAIIMDGNGRWARRRHLPRVAGHRAGVRPVRETIEACARLNLDALTLYAFSVENWKRPRAEVETLWHLLRRYLRQELPSLKKNNIRFQVIGRVEQTRRTRAQIRTARHTEARGHAHSPRCRVEHETLDPLANDCGDLGGLVGTAI